MNGQRFRVAIVGVGPTGLRCFERLLAYLAPQTSQVRIDLIHSHTSIGQGGVFAQELPRYLVANNPGLREFDLVLPNVQPPPACTIPSFASWYFERFGYRDDIQVSRSAVGEYHVHCGRLLSDAGILSSRVQVCHHVGVATDIHQDDGALRISVEKNPRSTFVRCDHVLLATGHGVSNDGRETLASIHADSVVGLSGFGLSAIDAILTLTEGRGGRFYTTPIGLRYVPSGREPQRLVPWCRSGTPILPAPRRLEQASRRLHLVSRAPWGDDVQLHWARDVAPVVMQEFRTQYCRLHGTNFPLNPRLLWEADRALVGRPAPRQQRDVLGEIRGLLKAAESPLARHRDALSAWYEISKVLAELVRHERFDAESHRFLVNRVAPTMSRIAFGANRDSLAKVVALADCGIVDLSGVTGSKEHAFRGVGCVVPTWEPRFDFFKMKSPLHSNLAMRGLLRPHSLPSSSGRELRSGALDLSPTHQLAINSQGVENARIVVAGPPSEGRFLGTWSLDQGEFPSRWASRILTLAREHRAHSTNGKT